MDEQHQQPNTRNKNIRINNLHNNNTLSLLPTLQNTTNEENITMTTLEQK